MKGDHTNFEIDPSFGVEASELYPDVNYATVEEYLDQFVWEITYVCAAWRGPQIQVLIKHRNHLPSVLQPNKRLHVTMEKFLRGWNGGCLLAFDESVKKIYVIIVDVHLFWISRSHLSTEPRDKCTVQFHFLNMKMMSNNILL